MSARGLVALILLISQTAFAAITLQDDTGRSITLTQPAQRIISLAPHVTELIYAVGAGAQLVGTDSSSNFPASAKKLPRIGDYSRINFERVAALQPDLAIGWTSGNRAADINKLRQMGIRVLLTDAHRLDDVARLLRLIGNVTAHPGAGETSARAFEAGLAKLRTRYGSKRVRRVFYQVWDKPLMTIGGRHWIHDAITLCGGRNIFADLQAASPIVSIEAVVARMPEMIISGSDAPDTRAIWSRFARLPAVQRKALLQIDADTLHRPSPRLLDGVNMLCQEMHKAQ